MTKIKATIFSLLSILFLQHSLYSKTEKRIVIPPYTYEVADANVATILSDANRGYTDYVYTAAWTQSGVEDISRIFIRFDMSVIPSGTEILDVQLNLHHNPLYSYNPSQHQGETSFYVKRLVGNSKQQNTLVQEETIVIVKK